MAGPGVEADKQHSAFKHSSYSDRAPFPENLSRVVRSSQRSTFSSLSSKPPFSISPERQTGPSGTKAGTHWVDRLSQTELLRWTPQSAEVGGVVSKSVINVTAPSVSESSNPVAKPATASSKVLVSKEPGPSQIQIGAYQFTPFSFQDEQPTLQSLISHPVTAMLANGSETVLTPPGPLMVTAENDLSYNASGKHVSFEKTDLKGGPMVDLSGYQDLTKPPVSSGGNSTTTLTEEEYGMETEYPSMSSSTTNYSSQGLSTHPEMSEADLEVYGEYSGNVKTLVQLVNDLPEGVTKQTGAQIIRLTMEAMGISMETVLSDAQSVQSQLLDAVRSNIKKIEEYKTVIRKLESEIRFHQGKANELSEIIDLFILSNTSPNMPNVEHNETSHY